MIFLSFFLAFDLLIMLHVSWIWNSNFMLFVVNVLINWETDLSWFEFKSVRFRWFYPTFYLVWRIVFAYLVVCRWQVLHGGQWRGSWREYETWCRGPGMVKHRSDTRWSDDQEVGWRYVRSPPYTKRRWAQVSWLSLKSKVDGLSMIWPQNH
jgi:hypothetical protein